MSVDLAAMLSTYEGVPSAFASARDGLDVVLRDRGWRRTTPEDTTAALERGARASATLGQLEGEGESITEDSLRISTRVLGQVGQFRAAPLTALAQLHAIAASAQPSNDRGRPRDATAADRLQRLARLLAEASSCPALVVAAIVHAEIAAATPFGSHNGVVARAAERLTFVARGVDPASVLVPEAGHLAKSGEYAAALAAYRDGGFVEGVDGAGGAGVQRWLSYAATAYVACVEFSPLTKGRHANGTQTDSGAAAHT